ITDLSWPNGIVDFRPGGPGFVLSDGALGMKWPWWLRRAGNLKTTGRRLDAPAPAMRFHHRPDYYSGIGFHASYLIFPSPACWEVTGHVDDESLTFVVLVQKIGEGPTHIKSLT